MTKNYDGEELSLQCGGITQDGDQCQRNVLYSIEEPIDDPMFELTPFCSDHRDQEAERNPGPIEDWTKIESF